METISFYDHNNELNLTRLGFGCARIFGEGEELWSTKLIEAALKVGIRHFDTAPSYASEQSETVLGKVVAGIPDVTITTKFGLSYDRPVTQNSLVQTYRRALRPFLARTPRLKRQLVKLFQKRPLITQKTENLERRIVTRDEILRSFEQSAARLKRDKIDLYLAHEPDQIILNSKVEETLDDLRRCGSIGIYGRAWDRAIDLEEPFGQVNQSRVPTSISVSLREPCILHGVLRHSSSKNQNMRKSPAARMGEALSTYRSSVILFSASHPHQIIDLVKQLGDEGFLLDR